VIRVFIAAFLGAVTAVPMNKMHQRAEKDESVREKLDRVRLMLRPNEIPANREETQQHETGTRPPEAAGRGIIGHGALRRGPSFRQTSPPAALGGGV
jgi:hypothetical protein